MKKSCLYFDKKYKCVSFIVRYKGPTLIQPWHKAEQFMSSRSPKRNLVKA